MEDINPTLRLTLSLRHHLLMGWSVKAALKKYHESVQDEIAQQIPGWIQTWETKGSLISKNQNSIYRQSLILLIERGLAGESILAQLQSLEGEVSAACLEEIDQHMRKLPYLLMIPLLLFQFPAYLILLLAPLFWEFMSAF